MNIKNKVMKNGTRIQGDQEVKIQTKYNEEREQGTMGLRQNTNKMQWRSWTRHNGIKVPKHKQSVRKKMTKALEFQEFKMITCEGEHN